MARYILIDNYTGYIWGDSADFEGRIFIGTPLEYAQALDESLGEHGRIYEMQSSADNGSTTGYHVYRADINGSDAVPVVMDGQSQETIDSVTSSCRYEGFVSAKRAAD